LGGPGLIAGFLPKGFPFYIQQYVTVIPLALSLSYDLMLNY